MRESTRAPILKYLTLLLTLGAGALRSGNLYAQSLFPPAEGILGGDAWERRLSPEFCIGSQNQKPAAGGTLRFYWGPFLGLEADYARVLSSASANPDDVFAFRLPFRVRLSADDFVAPFVSYVTGAWSHERVRALLLGLQYRGAILGLGYWLQASFTPRVSREVFEGSFQLDKSFEIARNAFSFIGVKVTERSANSIQESGVFLVSGSRF